MYNKNNNNKNNNNIIKYIYDIPKFTKKASLENTAEMLRRINFDESSKKIIHIAGTNGKGSVCAYLSKMLCVNNQDIRVKVGVFTSPHLVRMNERIVINNRIVSDEEFTEAFYRLKQVSEDMMAAGYVHPSFFEFLFGMAMYIFEKEKVNYIVLETGLGGRLDATNVIRKPVLTIITSIGLDHTDILGDTYEKIAREKAGIIKQGVPVVFADKRKDVTEVIERRAAECNSRVICLFREDVKEIQVRDKNIDFCLSNKYYDNVCFSVNSRGIYQVENAALAALAAKAVLGLADNVIKEGLLKAVWPGRMQQLNNGIIVDGAHNDDGITQFLESVKQDNCNGRRFLLFSAVKDKHYEGMIEKICKSGLFNTIVTGVIDDGRAIPAEDMRTAFAIYDNVRVIHCDSIKEAVNTLLMLKVKNTDKADDFLYSAGSLYLAGEIMALEK